MINPDKMTRYELMDFVNTHRDYSRQQMREFFGTPLKGYTKAFTLIIKYAIWRSVYLNDATLFENKAVINNYCESLYAELPAWAKWREETP